jgi:hypothetical protein
MKRLASTATWWQVHHRPITYSPSATGHTGPGRPAMTTIGLDLHKRESQLRIGAYTGKPSLCVTYWNRSRAAAVRCS